jgi:hypothetical protein
MKNIHLFALLWLSVSTAHAIDNACAINFFTDKQNALQLAAVNIAKGEKLHFYKDKEECPNAERCLSKAYLIKGDKVIVNAIEEGWACAWFQGKDINTVGWLQANYLQFQSVSNKQVSWSGIWQFKSQYQAPDKSKNKHWGEWGFQDKQIKFDKVGDKVHVTIEALSIDPDGDEKINLFRDKSGEASGELQINGHQARFSDGGTNEDCVKFTLLDNYLIAADNGTDCWGSAVSISGVYTKEKKH